MSKLILALLGCVNFLSLTFWMSNASAQTPLPTVVIKQTQQPKVNPNQITDTTATPAKRVTRVIYIDPRAFSLDANSDTVGDVAIAKFGCDCGNCRGMALQMLQTGQLPLPQ